MEAFSLWCCLLGDGISLQIIYVFICVVIHRQSGDRDPHLIKTNRHRMHPSSIWKRWYMQNNAYSLLSHSSVSWMAKRAWCEKNGENTHWRMYCSHIKLDLFSCTYFSLWLPQCDIKHLNLRCINIMLQALEQDIEDIKQGRNDNPYCLLVDKSVSPYTERKRKRPWAEVSI